MEDVAVLAQPPQRCRFGIFELDLGAGELRRNGLKIHLQEQPLRLLGILASRSGDVVTREELRRSLWPDGTFVDFDHGLNAAINKLRDALGDTAAKPQFIVTIPRRGYRFIAPVTAIGEIPTEKPHPPVRRRLVGIGAVLVAAIGGWLLMARRTEPPVSRPREVPLTSYPGSELYPSFSPDGNQVAFSWTGPNQDNSDIYVKVIGSEEPLRLTNSPSEELQPQWSPDGRHIAFLRKDPPSGIEIVMIPALGGPERPITRLGIPPWPKLGWEIARFFTWLPDSTGLVVCDRTPPAPSLSLFRISIHSGERKRLTSPENDDGHDSPAVSLDGRSLAFRSGRMPTYGLYVMPLGPDYSPAAAPRRVAYRPGFLANSPVWSPDGRFIVFDFGPQHGVRLKKVRADGSASPVDVIVDYRSPLQMAYSSVRSRLAYAEFRLNADVHSLSVSIPAGSQPAPRIASTFLDHMPMYSPDGRQIAFVSNRSGTLELWVCRRDGSSPNKLTNFGDSVVDFPWWSPDGRSIIFAGTVEGRRQLFRIAAQGGPTEQLTHGPHGSRAPSVSRDGKWIYFGREGQIWKMPPTGGRATPVGLHGGTRPLESWDGRYLYYAKSENGGGIWRKPLAGGKETLVVPSLNNTGAFDVARDGIYYVTESNPQGESSLNFYDFATESVRTIHTIREIVAWGLAVSPDSQREVLYTSAPASAADIRLVEGFSF